MTGIKKSAKLFTYSHFPFPIPFTFPSSNYFFQIRFLFQLPYLHFTSFGILSMHLGATDQREDLRTMALAMTRQSNQQNLHPKTQSSDMKLLTADRAFFSSSEHTSRWHRARGIFLTNDLDHDPPRLWAKMAPKK